jgi:hypothetical protein
MVGPVPDGGAVRAWWEFRRPVHLGGRIRTHVVGFEGRQDSPDYPTSPWRVARAGAYMVMPGERAAGRVQRSSGGSSPVDAT